MSSNTSKSTRRFSNVTKSIATAAAVVMIASAGLTCTAFAAQTCAGVKQAIDADGVYLYRFKDQRDPTLPLYVRYVKDEYKCGSGDILEPRLVPELDNCYVPTCVIGEGEENR